MEDATNKVDSRRINNQSEFPGTILQPNSQKYRKRRLNFDTTKTCAFNPLIIWISTETNGKYEVN